MGNIRTSVLVLFFLIVSGTFAYPEPFSRHDVYSQVKDLGHQLNLEPYEIDYLTAKLHEAAINSELARLLTEKPVQGVFVFSAVEGGVIFKFMKGKGFISFAEGGAGLPLWVECRSAGAMIGGSHMLGVGLIMGTISEYEVGGTYEGNVGGATFATESTPTGTAFWKTDGYPHQSRPLVYMVYMARGVSVGAGNARLTLIPGW